MRPFLIPFLDISTRAIFGVFNLSNNDTISHPPPFFLSDIPLPPRPPLRPPPTSFHSLFHLRETGEQSLGPTRLRVPLSVLPPPSPPSPFPLLSLCLCLSVSVSLSLSLSLCESLLNSNSDRLHSAEHKTPTRGGEGTNCSSERHGQLGARGNRRRGWGVFVTQRTRWPSHRMGHAERVHSLWPIFPSHVIWTESSGKMGDSLLERPSRWSQFRFVVVVVVVVDVVSFVLLFFVVIFLVLFVFQILWPILPSHVISEGS